MRAARAIIGGDAIVESRIVMLLAALDAIGSRRAFARDDKVGGFAIGDGIDGKKGAGGAVHEWTIDMTSKGGKPIVAWLQARGTALWFDDEIMGRFACRLHSSPHGHGLRCAHRLGGTDVELCQPGPRR